MSSLLKQRFIHSWRCHVLVLQGGQFETDDADIELSCMIKLFKFINNFQSINILRRQRRFSLSKSSCLTHAHSRSCIIVIYRIGTAGPSESDLISVVFTLRNAQFGAADTKIDNNIILLRLKSFWLILLSRALCEKKLL